MNIINLDDKIKNVLIRHVESHFKHHHLHLSLFSDPQKIIEEIDTDTKNGSMISLIVKLALNHFLVHNLHVDPEKGVIIYEKYDKKIFKMIRIFKKYSVIMIFIILINTTHVCLFYKWKKMIRIHLIYILNMILNIFDFQFSQYYAILRWMKQ